MRNPIATIYSWLVFKMGDLRWLGFREFPFILTWDVSLSEIKGYEVEQGRRYVQAGDIILTRHEGFPCNTFIGGAMIHAALAISPDEVVEAVGDNKGGVRRAHITDLLRADYVLVLRPQMVSYQDTRNAIQRALAVVGYHYDIFFDFRVHLEEKLIKADPVGAKQGKVRFCCTEIVYYAYAEKEEAIAFKKKRNVSFLTRVLSLLGLHVGSKILHADMLVEANTEVVWASKQCRPEWFKDKGCSAATVNKVQAYWQKRQQTT